MTKRITPPDWDQWDPNMCLIVGDAKQYYETFTSVVDEQATENKVAIGDLDGRVSALEHSTPVGPGGKGAYLNLGGTPERYPTKGEMIEGDTPEETSFLVVARNDGIYFYNPKTKLLIPPKKGGGTVAIHASFPDIFDEGHTIKHDTRIGKSGVYTARCADVGLDGNFLSYDTAKILVVTTADMEYQTALHPDGTASRTFTPGNNVQPWSFHTGTGGSGGSGVDPVVIQEINRRLALLEAKPDPVGTFEGLTDTQVDMISDAGGLIYLGHDGRIRGGAVNPMLAMGYTPVQAGSVGFHSVISPSTIAAVTIASSPVIVMTAEANRIATLPNVVPFETADPSTTQVRVGRVTYFVNASNTQKTLRVTSGQHFHKNGNMDTTNVVVPPKTTYIYNPAILDNGSGAMLECFVFMGQVAHEDADMTTILAEFARIQELHDGQQVELDFIKTEQEHGKLTVEGLQTTTTDLAERMNNLSLINLSDTPDSFVGNALKSVRVRAAEDGVEFIDSPETAILESLRTGNLPIKWNNMKQKIAASSNDISASSITENAFTLGLGSSNNKYFLPDIVDADTVPLPAESVREGRLTIISQQGTGTRTVELTNGCKFAAGGSFITTNLTIPAGQSWMLLPAIYSKGDKVWSLIGSFSSNHSGEDLVGGGVRVGHKNITADAFIVTNGSVNQEKTANCRLVAPISSSVRAITLPELVPFAHTGPLTSTQARQGKTITTWSASTSSTNLNLASGQKWLIDNVESEGTRILPAGVMETYFGIIAGGVGKWVLMHRTKADGSPVEFADLNIRLSALEAGGGGAGGADVGPLIIRLDDHQARIETLEANHGGVDLDPILDRIESLEELDLAPLTGRVTDVETFANSVETRVEVLENTPHPSFFDLTNTPSAGTPGKMLAFNMAGNALVAVDGVDSFRNLKDTPSSFSGQARKAVTVKSDESGLEFASLPNLAPLQGEVNDLYNDMIAVNNSQTIQDQRLTALEAASGGGGSDTFLGLTDTPSAYTAKKILTVNAAGTGIEMSQSTTDDLSGALMLAEGVTTGDVLLHQNCLGSPCVMSGEDVITATDIVNSSVILYSAWQNTNSVRLPKIAPYDASPLPLGHVRAGRITSIYNRTNNNKIIRVTVDPTSTGVLLKDRVYNDIPNVDLTANRVLKLMPAINAGVPVWIVIENYTCA